MLAFIQFLAFFAEAERGGGFDEIYNNYLNYPGFEAWKFLNLFVFVGLLIYLLRKPVSNAFRAKRESIRQELIRAKEERDAALAKLAEIEVKLASLDEETARIKEQSAREAENEKARIAAQTEADISKMRENARREIETAATRAKRELKRFAADESIRLAEDILRQKINAADAERLISAGINSLGANNGGLN
jgi:F-type H+-transporting ATPase subunit b